MLMEKRIIMPVKCSQCVYSTALFAQQYEYANALNARHLTTFRFKRVHRERINVYVNIEITTTAPHVFFFRGLLPRCAVFVLFGLSYFFIAARCP